MFKFLGNPIMTPVRALILSFGLVAVSLLIASPKHEDPENAAPPAPPAETKATDIASVTGHRVRYVVPDGTRRITARIRTPSGGLLREFVITNWVTIKPGQRLELVSE